MVRKSLLDLSNDRKTWIWTRDMNAVCRGTKRMETCNVTCGDRTVEHGQGEEGGEVIWPEQSLSDELSISHVCCQVLAGGKAEGGAEKETVAADEEENRYFPLVVVGGRVAVVGGGIYKRKRTAGSGTRTFWTVNCIVHLSNKSGRGRLVVLILLSGHSLLSFFSLSFFLTEWIFQLSFTASLWFPRVTGRVIVFEMT